MTYKYQKCPSCRELSTSETQTCPFCDIDLSVVNYHPWRRFFARSFDIAIFFFTFVLMVVIFFLLVEDSPKVFVLFEKNMGFFAHPLLNLPFNVLLLITFETLVLSVFGNSPGKKLFRIKLTHAQNNIPGLKSAFDRTFMVYLVGMAFLIPLLNFYALYLARKRLVKTGNTLWDARSNYHVSFLPFSKLYLIWMCFIYLLVMLLFLMMMRG